MQPKSQAPFDIFLQGLYARSRLSATTNGIYMSWVARCCRHYQQCHPLDVSPQALDAFRLYLLIEKHYSPVSDTIVYNAFRHTYCVLLPQVDPSAAKPYLTALSRPPRQAYHLPQNISQEQIQSLLAALPETLGGLVIREIYQSSRSFDAIVAAWHCKCSKKYAQQIVAQAARVAGIPHGFGLSGVRATSILHRLQNRQEDAEIVRIQEDSGLSPAQFQRYLPL